MPYIPGSPVEGYCVKCKSDTNHVVIEVAGVQIRQVRCSKCETEGSFMIPRAKTKAALMEYAEKRKSVPPPAKKTTTRSKKSAPPPPETIFNQLIEGVDLSTATPYNVKKSLVAGEVIKHSSFGIGVVTFVTDAQKAKVFFEDGERVMVCNRQ